MNIDWEFCEVLKFDSADQLTVLEVNDGMYRVRETEKIDEDKFYYETSGVTQVYR